MLEKFEKCAPMKVLFRPRAEGRILSLVPWMHEPPGRIASDANGKFVKDPGS